MITTISCVKNCQIYFGGVTNDRALEGRKRKEKQVLRDSLQRGMAVGRCWKIINSNYYTMFLSNN